MHIFPFILKELPFFLPQTSFSDETHLSSSCSRYSRFSQTVHIPAKLPQGPLTSGFFCRHVEPVGSWGSSGLWGQMLLWAGAWQVSLFSMDITWARAGSLFPPAILEQEDRPRVGGFEETSFWLSCSQLAFGCQVLVLRQPGCFAPEGAGSRFMPLPDNASAALVWSRCSLGGCCLLVLSLLLIPL